MPQIDAATLAQLSTAVQQLKDAVAQLQQTLAARQTAASTGGGGPAGAAAGNACMGADGTCTMNMGAGTGGAAGAPGDASGADPAQGSGSAPPTDPPPAPVAQDANTGPAPAPAPSNGKFHPGNFTPDQVGDASNKDDGKSACGPAAAIAFARYVGKDPSLDDTINKARGVGWTRSQGMAGPASEVKLLDRMGIKAHLEEGKVDWEKVKKVVMSGKPVIIDTPGHYWVAEKYDPATGKFDFGKSGSVFASAHGKHEYLPSELAGPGKGEPRGAIFLDG